jgi:hypothetical protein
MFIVFRFKRRALHNGVKEDLTGDVWQYKCRYELRANRLDRTDCIYSRVSGRAPGIACPNFNKSKPFMGYEEG